MKKIAFFIPLMGCARRCVYCDQNAITDSSAPTVQEVREVLSREREPVELAYFGGSFARIDVRVMTEYLSAIDAAPIGSTIRFSTHPTDLLDPERVDIISRYPIGTIELGTPSLDQRVLALCRREERTEVTLGVMRLLRDSGYHVGVQIMIGLPGQSATSSERDLHAIAQVKGGLSWDLRIYPCLVLKGTVLEKMFKAGEYSPLSLDEAIHTSGRLLVTARELAFLPIRIGLHETPSLCADVIAGPHCPSFGELAMGEELALSLARLPRSEWKIARRDISKFTGHSGYGIKRLASMTRASADEVRDNLKIIES